MGECAVVTLTRNFRSSGAIVAASKAVIAANPRRAEKDVHTTNAHGAPVEVCECRNQQCEADWVVCKLTELKAEGIPLGRTAVLYRTHAVGNQLRGALKQRKVPCAEACSVAAVFDRVDVAPIVMVLRLVANPCDASRTQRATHSLRLLLLLTALLPSHYRCDDGAFRRLATLVVPPLPPPLVDIIATAAAAANQSLLPAARALYAATSPAAGARAGGSQGSQQQPGGEAYAAAAARLRLEAPWREALARTLRDLDDLGRFARAQSPSRLLTRIVEMRMFGEKVRRAGVATARIPPSATPCVTAALPTSPPPRPLLSGAARGAPLRPPPPRQRAHHRARSRPADAAPPRVHRRFARPRHAARRRRRRRLRCRRPRHPWWLRHPGCVWREPRDAACAVVDGDGGRTGTEQRSAGGSEGLRRATRPG